MGEYEDSFKRAGIARGIGQAVNRYQNAALNMQNLQQARAKRKEEEETFNIDMKIKKLDLQKAERDPTQDPALLDLQKEGLKAKATNFKTATSFGEKAFRVAAPAIIKELEDAKGDVTRMGETMRMFGATIDPEKGLSFAPAKNKTVDDLTDDQAFKTFGNMITEGLIDEEDPADKELITAVKNRIRKTQGLGSATGTGSAKTEFASMEEAEAANIPSGTEITIAGKRYKAN